MFKIKSILLSNNQRLINICLINRKFSSRICSNYYEFNENSFNHKKIIDTNSRNNFQIISKRFVSNNIPSKQKSISKNESQLKLAQMQTKSQINSFPLLKEENFDLNQFSIQFKDLLELIEICNENNLNNTIYYPSVSTVLNGRYFDIFFETFCFLDLII
jgi:hypothetical protein